MLLTGGPASFGVGGYFKSVLDPFLPVSMEVKNEHRKLSLAMAVVLDRSGSMAAPAGDGRTKMDLANLGTCAAIETLGPFDEVAVIAVDSAPHVIAPLTSASDKDRICDEVRRIQSMGGGIFTYTALVTAAKIVQESDKGTRHIVLFADAADAEEPGEYQRLLDTLKPLGITVSVIGLGSESDPDAAFLKDVAARGQGRIHFTASVDELPRLFAQEAITVARSSFVTEPTAARALPDMVLLGELPASSFPALDGYNLTYLRPGATMGVVTTDEYKAPVLAFWHRGLGRVASLTAEVDGQYSQRLNAWKDFQSFSVGLGRWLLGGEPPSGVQASIERRGGQGIVRVELDPGRTPGGADDVRAATATIVPPDERAGGQSERLTLAWVGADTLEATVPASEGGDVPRRRSIGDQCRAPARAAQSSLLTGIRAAVGPRRGSQDTARDRADHRRRRADDLGRRLHVDPCPEPSGARPGDAAHADAAGPARGRDRRAAAVAFRGRARVAGNDRVPTASAGTAAAAGSLTGSAECAARWDTTGGATQTRHLAIGARQGQGAQPDGALSERTVASVAGALSPNSVPPSRRPPHSAFLAPARPDLEATDSRGRAAQPGTWRSSAVGGRIVRRAS